MSILDDWARRRTLARLTDADVATLAMTRGYVPAPLRMFDMGESASDEDMDGDKYLSYARTSNPVYACATLRANMLGALPLKCYRLGTPAKAKGAKVRSVADPLARLGMPATVRGKRLADAGEVTEVESGKLAELLAKVAPGWTQRRLVYMTEMSLCLSGQTYWQLDRGTNGTTAPSAIYYLRHTRVSPVKGRASSDPPITGWTLDGAEVGGGVPLTFGEIMWIRYPDPTDPDYGALSPLCAARLGADVYAAAMKNNWAIFANGLAPGGFILPPEGQVWDDTQLTEATEAIRQRLEGTDKRHRWLFLPEAYKVQTNTLTPKDAEFLGGLDFAVEDIARAYGLPIEMVGGARRTYQNLENAQKGVWSQTLEPEARFLADEMTENLCPMFGGEVDFVAFDLSGVTALQDDEAAEWARAREQLASGAITTNEWRTDQGMEPLATAVTLEVGKVQSLIGLLQAVGMGSITTEQAKAVISLALGLGDAAAAAIVGNERPAITTEPAPPTPVLPPPVESGAPSEGLPETDGMEARAAGRPKVDALGYPAFGSPTHERQWRAVVDETAKHEKAVVTMLRGVFRRWRDSVLDSMRSPHGGHVRDHGDLSDWEDAVDPAHWERELRTASRPVFGQIADAAGRALADELGSEFDGDDPEVVRAMIAQAQRFAKPVAATTWDDLRRTLAEGIGKGEGLPMLTDRVRRQFDRVLDQEHADRAEMIARTETTRAWNIGAHKAAKQSGVVGSKTWISALDERTREWHRAAHGQTVGIDEPFHVGGDLGPSPGNMGGAANDINCRCVAQFNADAVGPGVVVAPGEVEPEPVETTGDTIIGADTTSEAKLTGTIPKTAQATEDWLRAKRPDIDWTGVSDLSDEDARAFARTMVRIDGEYPELVDRLGRVTVGPMPEECGPNACAVYTPTIRGQINLDSRVFSEDGYRLGQDLPNTLRHEFGHHMTMTQLEFDWPNGAQEGGMVSTLKVAGIDTSPMQRALERAFERARDVSEYAASKDVEMAAEGYAVQRGRVKYHHTTIATKALPTRWVQLAERMYQEYRTGTMTRDRAMEFMGEFDALKPERL